MGLAALKQAVTTALVRCAMLAHVPAANAQTPEGDLTNAATWYRAAAAECSRIGFNTTEFYEPVWAFDSDPDRGPSAEARSILRRSREALNLARRGARRDLCDFGPYDPFDETGRDEIVAIRTAARVVRYDFMLRMIDGDSDRAIDDCIEVLRMSRHAASQRATISVLIGAALVHFADGMLQQAFDRAIIDAGRASRLLRAMAKFDGPDPLGFGKAMIEANASYPDALAVRYAGEEGLQRFRDDHLPYFQQTFDDNGVAEVEALTRAELAEFLRQEREISRQEAAAWAQHDPNGILAALKATDEAKAASRFSRLLRFSLGGGARTFETMRQVRTTLDERIVTLTGIASGTVDPLSLANAACWYVQAGVRLEHVDPAALALIDDFARDMHAGAKVTPELLAALARDDVRAVLVLLQIASTIARCDFSYATGNWTQYYSPYHADLLACGRLLSADAGGRIHHGDAMGAAERVIQLFKTSADLAKTPGDRVVGNALVAHRLFNEAQMVATQAIEGRLANSQRTTLRDVLARFNPADPFQYEPCRESLRTVVRGYLLFLVRGAPKINGAQRPYNEQEEQEADEIISQLDADRLLSILAACEEYHMTSGLVARPIRAPVDGLWPIFDLEALQRARELQPVLWQWAKMRAIGGLPQANLPLIAPVEARAKQSIEDFRECVRRLGADLGSIAPATMPE